MIGDVNLCRSIEPTESLKKKPKKIMENDFGHDSSVSFSIFFCFSLLSVSDPWNAIAFIK